MDATEKSLKGINMTPEKLFECLQKKIKKEWILCALSVLVFGFLAHGYRFSNNLPNWDALLNEYSSQDTTYLGRCFLSLACGFSSWYELPWLNGILSLVYLQLLAILTCEILNFRRKASYIMAGGLIAVFPAVTSTFCYIYTADGYFLGALCMTFAVWLLCKKKRAVIPAALLICFGSGIYQAYITWAITLILLSALCRLLFEKEDVKSVFAFGGRSLLAGVGGSALYYVLLSLIMKIRGIGLDEYQGITEAYQFSELNPLYSIKQCIRNTLTFLFGNGRINAYVILNICLIAFIFIFTFYLLVKQQIKKEPLRLLCVLAVGLLLPFGCFALLFLSPYVNCHMLMCFAMCGIYLYPLKLYEQYTGRKRETAVRQWGVVLLLFMLLFQFVVLANVTYHTLEMSFEKSRSIIIRMADRIEQTEGWEGGKKLAVLGRLPETKEYFIDFPPNMTGTAANLVIRENFNVRAMLEDYGDIRAEAVSEEQERELLQSQSYKDMPSWPKEGSVAWVNDILVVKLGEGE